MVLRIYQVSDDGMLGGRFQISVLSFGLLSIVLIVDPTWAWLLSRGQYSLSCSSQSSLDNISIKQVNKIELRSFEC